MTISCCPACAEKLRQTYWITETDEAPHTGWCNLTMPRHFAMLTQYEATPQRQTRYRAYRQSRSGPPKKDSRAYYREPFRSEME